jgi:iron complex outermembrane receptor protein
MPRWSPAPLLLTVLPLLSPAAETPPEPKLAEPPLLAGAETDLSLLDERRWVAAVSAGRRQALEEAPAPVEVLTRDDVFESPAITWVDRLRYVPGVDVYRHRHAQFDVGMRGDNSLANPHLLVLVDGRPLVYPETGTGLWMGAIYPTDVTRTEIIKGPASVTYGANAFGGVIALDARRVGDQPAFHAMALYGDTGHRELDGTALVPLRFGTQAPDLYLKASAGTTRAEDWSAPTAWPEYIPSERTGATNETDLRSDRAQATLGVHLGAGHDLEGEFRALDIADWSMVGPYTAVTDETNILTREGGLRLRATWGELRWRREIVDADWASEYAYYDPSFDYYYNQAGFANEHDELSGVARHRFGDHELAVGGRYDRTASDSNIWVDGRGQVGYSRLDPSTWGSISSETLGAYAEDQWRILPQLQLAAGLRYDHHSLVGGNWSPRLAANWSVTERQFLRLSYSHGYRIPSPIEGYLQEYFFAADPDIRAETIDAVELGWRHRLGVHGHVGIGGFYNRADNLLWFAPRPPWETSLAWQRWLRLPPFGSGQGPDPRTQPGPFFSVTNLDNVRHSAGIETDVRGRILDEALELWANATWQRSLYEDPIVYANPGVPNPITGGYALLYYGDLGRELNAPPVWKANAGATWRWRGFFASVAGRYVAGREVFSFPSSFWISRPVPATGKVEDYLSLDAGTGWRGDTMIGRCSIKLSAMDIGRGSHYETYQRPLHDVAIDLGRQYTAPVPMTWAMQGWWDW